MLLLLINLLAIWTFQAQASLPTYKLNDGREIPVVALGTAGPIANPDVIVQAVYTALCGGYRHIDTAAFYHCEVFVGQGISLAIENGCVTRDEIFVTTKRDPRVTTGDGVLGSITESLRRLNITYADLYLIHVPTNVYTGEVNDHIDLWKGMEEVKKLGLAKSIGVANFDSTMINNILTNCDIPPAVNEIEVNPAFTNLELVTYCQSLNITVLAYAPAGYVVPRSFRFDVNPTPAPSSDDPLLKKLAAKYGKTPYQVGIRYLIDRGIVPLPKSYTKEHIKENIDIFDFSLTEEEISQINNFNNNTKVYLFDQNTLTAMSEYFFGVDFVTALSMPQ